MEIKKKFNRVIKYIDKELRVEYDKGILHFINTQNLGICQIALYDSVFGKAICNITALERMLRVEPRYIIRISENYFLLSHQCYLYQVDIIKSEKKRIFHYNPGTRNPLYFCDYWRNGKREIVFGDYGGHDENGNVGIYRICLDALNNCMIEEISFINGDLVNHIHRVQYDEWRDCYWVFTGDTDEKSGIWKLKYEGKEQPEPFLVGRQGYRACVAFITESDILYATDSPIENNYIYRLRIDTKELTEICKIPGSCIYGTEARCTDGERIFCLATAVEPDSSLHGMRYYFTSRLGCGIEDYFSHVLIGNPTRGFIEAWKSKKDWYPMGLFQFGNQRFPTQNIETEIYFCPQSCINKGTYVIKL